MSDASQIPPVQQTPQDLYRRDLAQGGITPDASQEKAVAALQHIYDALARKWDRNSGWKRLLQALGMGGSQAVQGLYLWGGSRSG